MISPTVRRPSIGVAAAALAFAVGTSGVISRGESGQATARARLAELWHAPPTSRDLFLGVGGRRLTPNPRAVYTVIEIKTTGFSEGYTVVDEQQREWSTKFSPEARPEVAASRLLWGLGYHQPPIYLLEAWRASRATGMNPQREARFREKSPDFHGLNAKGSWAYDDNPFVGTRPWAGLLVLQAMLGNSDLKPEQNVIYELDRQVEGASRWFVARDLGQTFGRTGRFDPPRGDPEVFERAPFIRGVEGDRVILEYQGRHQELFENITVADVHWICDRLRRLTDRQWRDLFRAAGYDRPTSDRFIRRFKQKIAEGLALPRPKGRMS